MDDYAGNTVKTLLQILAILGLILIVTMILHKGSVDISALAQQYSGDEFWKALARYLLRNLGAGSSSGS